MISPPPHPLLQYTWVQIAFDTRKKNQKLRLASTEVIFKASESEVDYIKGDTPLELF